MSRSVMVILMGLISPCFSKRARISNNSAAAPGSPFSAGAPKRFIIISTRGARFDFPRSLNSAGKFKTFLMISASVGILRLPGLWDWRGAPQF
jgi:hypothetical protein